MRIILFGLSTMVFGGAAIMLATQFSPPQRKLRECDEAIKAELNAPSTYERIAPGFTYSSNSSYIDITFDAANAYGVPLRRTAYCSLPSSGSGPAWVRLQ